MADFYGLPTRSVESTHVRLEFLAEAGPRIVRLFVAGVDENQLAELPDFRTSTPFGEYFFRGGHRLWHAPEAMPRSYLPDDMGVQVEERADGVRLVQPTEAASGIRKCLDIQLHPEQAAVTLHHQLQNEGMWAVELAPWALTMLPLGGMAILPQQVGPLDPSGLLPNRHLVLWPYTRWQDPRLELHDDYLLLYAQPLLPPCKVGYLNRQGWIAYVRNGVLFRKRFTPQAALPHPDFGCNAEFYCDDTFIEMETVAPLARLEPGQAVTHTETWEFATGIAVPQTLDGARALAGTRGLRQP
jgi:hypothetical protein